MHCGTPVTASHILTAHLPQLGDINAPLKQIVLNMARLLATRTLLHISHPLGQFASVLESCPDWRNIDLDKINLVQCQEHVNHVAELVVETLTMIEQMA